MIIDQAISHKQQATEPVDIHPSELTQLAILLSPTSRLLRGCVDIRSHTDQASNPNMSRTRWYSTKGNMTIDGFLDASHTALKQAYHAPHQLLPRPAGPPSTRKLARSRFTATRSTMPTTTCSHAAPKASLSRSAPTNSTSSWSTILTRNQLLPRPAGPRP